MVEKVFQFLKPSIKKKEGRKNKRKREKRKNEFQPVSLHLKHPSAREAEMGGSLRLADQPSLPNQTAPGQ